MSNPRHWMQTYSGGAFRFDEPTSLELNIKDISRPLSRLPRFNGHTSRPLSVAEHSLVVRRILHNWGMNELVQLHGLMHDAHEAFTGDIISPFKRFLYEVMLVDIAAIQAEIQVNIFAAFNIPMLSRLEFVEQIKKADLYACKLERDLVMKSSLEWDIDDTKIWDPADYEMYEFMPAVDADDRFRVQFKRLMGKINRTC